MLDVGKLMNCQPIRRYRKLFGRELTDEDDPLSLSQEKGKGLAKGFFYSLPNFTQTSKCS
jgi:hypothetical protein